jgi:Glycosyltransferase family 87
VQKPPTTTGVRIGTALASAILFCSIFGMTVYNQAEKADFGALYTGGLMVVQGRASELYDLHDQTLVQEQFLGRKGLLLYVYPPFHALFFAPLALLPYRLAYVVWGGINILLWVLFQLILRREMGMGARLSTDVLVLCSLFCPLWIALVQGQLSILVLVVLALTFASLRKGRDYAAGLILGLGLMKFQYVLPFAAIFLLRRKWKFMTGFFATAAVLGLISIAALGPRCVFSYMALLTDIMMHPSRSLYSTIRPSNMPTMRALVLGLFGGNISNGWISALALLLSGGLICLAAWFWNREEQRSNRAGFDLIFAAAVTVSLLATPYLYVHDLTPMLLAVLVVMSSMRWEVKSTERFVLAGSSAILYAAPLYIFLMGRGELFLVAPVLVVFAVASLSLAKRASPLRNAGAPKLGWIESQSSEAVGGLRNRSEGRSL